MPTAVVTHCEQVGLERALIYKTLALTGLRKGELSSITVGNLRLDGAHPYLVLEAKNEKNRKGANIPLTDDLAADIASWLDIRLEMLRAAARDAEQPIPMRLTMDTLLFNVGAQLSRCLKADLDAAGIKEDALGRVIDVHSFRYTFCTHLGKNGVPLRTVQAAMRHSDPKLTANIYTDLELLDLAGAIRKLPSVPLHTPQAEIVEAVVGAEAQAAELLETDGRGDSPLAVPLAVNGCKNVHKSSSDFIEIAEEDIRVLRGAFEETTVNTVVLWWFHWCLPPEIEWRPKCVALNNPTLTFTFNPNQNAPKRLRFNPILIAEWLQELLDAGMAESQNKLATSLGRSRTQVMQYLRLLTLPGEMRAKLRLDPDIREGNLRAMTKEIREGRPIQMDRFVRSGRSQA